MLPLWLYVLLPSLSQHSDARTRPLGPIAALTWRAPRGAGTRARGREGLWLRECLLSLAMQRHSAAFKKTTLLCEAARG
jgi:hypothetical protein